MACLVSHPIQYQAPLLRYLAAQPELDLTALFLSDLSAREYQDPGFGVPVRWDVPLLDGYRHVFLPGVGRRDRLSFWRPLVRGFGRILKAGDFDALWVHGYSHQAILRAIAAAKALGIPVLMRGESHLQSATRSRAKEWLKQRVMPGFFRSIDTFLTIGTLNKEYYRHYGVPDERIFLMPYAVDNAFFRGQVAEARRERELFRAQLGLEPGRPVILFASKLQPRKRAADLLEAYRKLSPDGLREPKAYLLFVGDGEERPRLERLAETLGWSSVRFLGFKNQGEISRFYDLADVFVLPSEHEPWGLVVNEVMNAAKPVIVSDQVGAGPDLVEDGENGFVVPLGDVATLAERLGRVISQPELARAMGEESYRRIGGWDFRADLRGLLNALDDVVGRHGRLASTERGPAEDSPGTALGKGALQVGQRSLLGRRLVGTAGTNVVLALLGVATGVLAARLLGPEGRGQLAAIQAWPSVIATVAMLGLPDALVYFSAREPKRSGRHLGSAMTLTLLTSVLFVAAGYLAMPLLLSAQLPETMAAARWYLLLIPLFALVGMPFHPLRGCGDFAAWNILRVTPSLGLLGVLLLAWLLGRVEAEFVAASYLAVVAMLSVPVAYVVGRRIPAPFWPEVGSWTKMLRYGLPSMLSGTPHLLNARLDQLVIAAFLPASALGLYAVAAAWGMAANPIASALGAVLFPWVASQRTTAEQQQGFAQGTRLAASVSGLAGLGAVVTPWGLPFLFGSEFAMAIPAAAVLMLAGAVATWNANVEEGLRGLGHPAVVMKAELGGLLVSGIALVMLVEPFGVVGAAAASLMGHSAVGALLLNHAQRLTGYPMRGLLWPRLDDLPQGVARSLGWR